MNEERKAGSCSLCLDLFRPGLPGSEGRALWRQLGATVARCFWRDGGRRQGHTLLLFLGGCGTGAAAFWADRTCLGSPRKEASTGTSVSGFSWFVNVLLFHPCVALLSACCVLGIGLSLRPEGGQTKSLSCFQGTQVSREGLLGRPPRLAVAFPGRSRRVREDVGHVAEGSPGCV